MKAVDVKIQPDDIDVPAHFIGVFGQCEAETSANWLVQFAQARGEGWESFKKEDIRKFYNRAGYDGEFHFNKLVPDFIELDDGVYYFTLEFVTRCYASCPSVISYDVVTKRLF